MAKKENNDNEKNLTEAEVQQSRQDTKVIYYKEVKPNETWKEWAFKTFVFCTYFAFYFGLFACAIIVCCAVSRAEEVPYSNFDDQEEAFDAELYGEPLPEKAKTPVVVLEQGYDNKTDCFTAFDSSTGETIIDCCLADGERC